MASEMEGNQSPDYMDILRKLYRDAGDGNLNAFREHETYLDKLVTPCENTVLHIYITASSRPFHNKKTKTPEANFVGEVLKNEKFTHLLRKPNKKGETPLHVAARHGRVDVVKTLISKCEEAHGKEGSVEELLSMKNKAKDTALHEAVRYGHLEVVEELIRKKADVSYAAANKAGETPLYLAAERGLREVVKVLLNKCLPSPLDTGPLGKTALHAAVLRNSKEITKILLKSSKGDLTKKADQEGWIPLHYAAYFGHLGVVKDLLMSDKSSADKGTKLGETPLHLAAFRGQVKVMEEIIKTCPECCELADDEDWNVLHYAVKSGKEEAVKCVLSNSWLRSLINEKNKEGNTPLHLLALDESDCCMKSLISHSEVDKQAFNNDNLSALDIARMCKSGVGEVEQEIKKCFKKPAVPPVRRIIILEDEIGKVVTSKQATDQDREEQAGGEIAAAESNKGKAVSNKISKGDASKKQKEKDIMDFIRDAQQSHIVAAAVIATVAFAAGFTFPGGYKEEASVDEGGPILIRRGAFQAFVISNTLAMMLSSAAVFFHLFIGLAKDKSKVCSLFQRALLFTLVAMIAMVIAFITGSYAVFVRHRAIAISACVVGSLFFLFTTSAKMLLIFLETVVYLLKGQLEHFKEVVGKKGAEKSLDMGPMNQVKGLIGSVLKKMKKKKKLLENSTKGEGEHKSKEGAALV